MFTEVKFTVVHSVRRALYLKSYPDILYCEYLIPIQHATTHNNTQEHTTTDNQLTAREGSDLM